MSSIEYQLVTDDDALRLAVSRCRQRSVVAIDTEFARFNTYYPIVGLIQLYDGEDCYLIDPLEIENLAILGDILWDKDIVKVLHAGSEDMEVFQHELGRLPEPVFDTQIAAGLLGVGFSMGYQALVEHYLDISLPKDQTRSDWLARPLSEQQLRYAALDVIHLHHVYHKMQEQLEASGKAGWATSESALLGQDIATMVSPEECYKKVKGLWQLDRLQLNELRALFAWRERKAREANRPRNHLIDQKVLVALVKEGRATKQSFADILSPRQLRKYGDEILFVMSEAKQVKPEDCPPRVTKADAPVDSKKLKKLRQVVANESERHSIVPELLVKRRHLEKLIRSADADGQYHLPNELQGWREDLLGPSLLSALVE